MLILQPQTRYDMPATFGPSLMPDVTAFESTQSVAIPFVTDHAAVARLLPRYYAATDEPVVTVSSSMLRGADYMGGRGYNLVSVSVSAVYTGPDQTLRAPYSLVIWESDANPIIAGREFLGAPKLFGRIPDHVAEPDGWSFSCSEYDGLLVTGRVTGLTPVVGDALEAIKRVPPTGTLGWKYISGPGGVPDVDYPIRFMQTSDIHEMWTGTGEIRWGNPSFQESPISSRIVEVLRELPVLAYRPAIAARGTGQMRRDRTERLLWE